MIKQVENVGGPIQRSVFKHDHFFYEMGHGFKWNKDHNDRKHNEYRIGYFVKK